MPYEKIPGSFTSSLDYKDPIHKTMENTENVVFCFQKRRIYILCNQIIDKECFFFFPTGGP